MQPMTLDEILALPQQQRVQLAETKFIAASALDETRAEIDRMADESRRNTERLLRLPAVLAKVGYGRSHVLDLVTRQLFPPPVRLSPGGTRSAVAWRESEIDEWIASRPRATRGEGRTDV